MTDGKPITVLTKDLGSSIASYRLSRNLRQDDVATQAGVSRGVVARLEAGEGGTIDSLIRVLKALGLGDRLSALVPDTTISPLAQRGLGDQRQRARPAQSADGNEPWTWGE